MQDLDQLLWTERFRPHTVQETILPGELKETCQKFIDQREIPNLLLVGKSGVGKTSIALAMMNEIGADFIMINGSLDAGIDVLRTDIQQFASTVSFSGARKYVILDEADHLGADRVQPALRAFMENYAANCGFILTANYKAKIIPALQSRCSVIDFKIDWSHELGAAFFKRCKSILSEIGINYDQKVVAALINKHYPDWRRILNELQRYSVDGKIIDSGILSVIKNDELKTIFDNMKEKNFSKLRKWVAENLDVDQNELYTRLYDAAPTYLTTAGIAQLVLIIGKYQFQAPFCASAEINIAACLTDLMVSVEFK